MKKQSGKSSKSDQLQSDYNCTQFNSQAFDEIIRKSVQQRGLVSHHIEGFDALTDGGIAKILQDVFKTETNISLLPGQNSDAFGDFSNIHVMIKFSNIRVDWPQKPGVSKEISFMTPTIARNNNLNYCAKVRTNVSIVAKAYRENGDHREKTAEIRDFEIMQLPIMTNSKHCNMSGHSWQYKLLHGEDPLDPGGKFVLHGKDWSIDCVESVPFNQPRITYNIGHKNEVTRLQILCKLGDSFENSSDIIIRFESSGNITVEFASITSSPLLLKEIPIPITILFRLFGMSRDKEIFDNIVLTYSTAEQPNEISRHIMQVLQTCFGTSDKFFERLGQERDREKLFQQFTRIVAEINYKKDPKLSTRYGSVDALQQLFISKFDDMFCKYMFPHMGVSRDNYFDKLRYMGLLVRRMILVQMQVAKPLNYENLENKRVSTAGHSISRELKMSVNTCVVQPALRSFETEMRNNKFENVDLTQTFTTKVSPEKLTKSIIKAIASSKKETAPDAKQSRITSEQVMLKNELYALSVARLVRGRGTIAKSSARSIEMRSVHPSYTYALCPTQSADTGDQVGLVRQLTLAALISSSGDSTNLKLRLLDDSDIIPLRQLLPADVSKLTNIYVNGAWIGACRHAYAIVRRYRELRRGYKHVDAAKSTQVHEYSANLAAILSESYVHTGDRLADSASIQWDTTNKQINFWIDSGRILYPLIVVRNNTVLDPIGCNTIGSKHGLYDAVANKNFHQDILLTETMLHNKITLPQLLDAGVIEYISADEIQGLFVAPSVEVLTQHRNDALLQFTHCGIPVALMGIPALTCPYMTHNQSPRVVYQTNQAKQTSGWPSLAHANRTDKSLYMQWNCSRPLIETIANDYIYPNGSNVIVAIYDPNGDNQEDSIIGNKTSSQRGLFCMQVYTTESVEIRDGCSVETPNGTTHPRNSNYSYEHLVDGLPKIGAVLRKNDVLVGMVEKLSEAAGKYMYRDVSTVYDGDETIRIEMIKRGIDSEDKPIINIKFSAKRSFGVGHKFSSRHGQKAMTGEMIHAEDMPYTASGLVPDILLSPHAIPSRMTIGQLLEAVGSKSAALRACIDRASAFTELDVNAMCDSLEAAGAYRYGTEACYDGLTGEWINVRIMICPTFYQRLQKFVEEELYSVVDAKRDPITRQPTEGRQRDGGLRFGEMEKDCATGNGTGTFNIEMTRDNSDPIKVYFCSTCGMQAVVNTNIDMSICHMCKRNKQVANIQKIRTGYTSILWTNELAGCGAQPKAFLGN